MINYTDYIQQSLRNVVKSILQDVERKGIQDENHFYITFLTHFNGVVISEKLKKLYPNEMTIVLQHEFWKLKVDDLCFWVNLSFGSEIERLCVPFASITRFVDPSENFILDFVPDDESEFGEDDDNIIKLDAFRKNKKDQC